MPFYRKRVSTVSARDNSTLLSSPQTNKRRRHFASPQTAHTCLPIQLMPRLIAEAKTTQPSPARKEKCPRLTSRRAQLAPRLASARNRVRLRSGSDLFSPRLKCQRRLQKQHAENVTNAPKNPKIIRPIRLKQSGLADHHQSTLCCFSSRNRDIKRSEKDYLPIRLRDAPYHTILSHTILRSFPKLCSALQITKCAAAPTLHARKLESITFF